MFLRVAQYKSKIHIQKQQANGDCNIDVYKSEGHKPDDNKEKKKKDYDLRFQ